MRRSGTASEARCRQAHPEYPTPELQGWLLVGRVSAAQVLALHARSVAQRAKRVAVLRLIQS